MKVLPFCAVCKKERKENWTDSLGRKYCDSQADGHEFVPCVSLKDVLEIKEEGLRLVKQLEERDKRLAKKINFIKNKAASKLLYDLLDGFEKELVGELRKK